MWDKLFIKLRKQINK